MEFLRFLSQYRLPPLDVLFQLITILAQETVIVAVICWLYWCVDKRLAYTLGFSFFVSGLCVQGLKITFRIPRPWVLDPDFKPVASALSGATGYSFPSGHTQSATSLLSTLCFSTHRKRLRILCVAGFLAVGFSRMYLGVHTPKDVCVSMAVTLVLSALSYALFGRIADDHSKDLIVSIILTAVSAGLLVYAQLLHSNGVIELEYAMDCFKSGGAGLAFAVGFCLERRFVNFSLPGGLKTCILRFAAGMAVTLVLQIGLRFLFPDTLFFGTLRYFLLVFWILVLYPYIFMRLFSQKLS